MAHTQILTLRNDYLFKLLLGSEENKVCLQDFLECVLEMEARAIAGLELVDKELAKDAVTDKTGIVDVKENLSPALCSTGQRCTQNAFKKVSRIRI